MGDAYHDFGIDDLRVVGGDYGQIILEGRTEAARKRIQQIVGSIGCGSFEPGVSLGIHYDDDAAPVIEDRHAGFEGQTTIFDIVDGGAADGTGSEETSAEESAGER